MTFNASSGQQAALPVNSGTGTLSGDSQALSSSATTHIAWDVTGVPEIAVTMLRFGTLTADCSLTLQISIDGGTNFRDYKTYANAAINVPAGLADVVRVKATHARFVLNPGSMTGPNGLNVLALI